ncbi:MAG: hypothetical protein J6Q85_04765 [Clostridia bacterium]|nr:hypothetical protein [Clostridia bacterium]
MKKIIALLLVAVVVCLTFAGCSSTELNYETNNILYNDIVYERCVGENYNIQIFEDNASYTGVFIEIYAYGQELPWEVYVLNSEANILYSSHAIWVKPGYAIPDNFGVEFSSVEYVVPNGLDFLIMEDGYTEEVTPLMTFSGSIKLEDIVETAVSEITDYVEYDVIRFGYVDHADIKAEYDICSYEGKYYLNVRQGEYGTDELHEIKAEYVELLTSAIPNER